jgi:hypothetical protein
VVPASPAAHSLEEEIVTNIGIKVGRDRMALSATGSHPS